MNDGELETQYNKDYTGFLTKRVDESDYTIRQNQTFMKCRHLVIIFVHQFFKQLYPYLIEIKWFVYWTQLP